MKTYSAKPGEIERKWYLIDAEDVVLGRLATKCATILRGKNKPQFTPHVDTGDFVVVINAEKIRVTGKKATDKEYFHHSGHPGGLKSETLEEALKNKGGNADIVLREGDVIFIPEMNNTVKISGTVMYPNTVTYKKGAKISYYINQAGGFGNRAKKTKVYVVYANGNVAKAKRLSGAKIEPGCEIIVPSKPERNANSLTQTITIASSVTSMAAMIATLYNAFK